MRLAQAAAAAVSDTLVATGGYPANWTNSTVVTIGLAAEENVVYEPRVQELGDIQYNSSKAFLPLSGFEYFLNISSAASNATIFAYGNSSYSGAAVIMPIQRLVLYDYGNGTRKIAKFLVVVWK